MNRKFAQIRRDLQWLRGEDGVVPAAEAVAVLARVLEPLLALERFTVSDAEPGRDEGVDLVARRSEAEGADAEYLGIQYKHHGLGRPIEIDAVHQIVGAQTSGPYDRLMLIGRFGFTPSAIELAHRVDPVSIELLDLNGIERWIARIEAGEPPHAHPNRHSAHQIQLLIMSVSHEFAKLVAREPSTLDHLEWRDLERMMARVMEALGFDVTLTPPSKDGGKDLILNCRATRGLESFIVELKHWRSGKRVGKAAVSDFFEVIVSEERSGGLFLSTSGYNTDAFEGLTEITRQRLRLGEKTKVVLLAQTYFRATSGLWSPPADLPQVLFEATV